MPETFPCFQPCLKDEAFAGELHDMRMFWVLLESGEVMQWFDRPVWPKCVVTFVRPVQLVRDEHGNWRLAESSAEVAA